MSKIEHYQKWRTWLHYCNSIRAHLSFFFLHSLCSFVVPLFSISTYSSCLIVTTDRAQWSPYKNDRGPIFSSTARPSLACVADETKPRYSPSASQRPKACSVPRVLPGFSIIGSNWLLHMAVLSCTVIGRVDLVEPWSRWRLRIPDTQNKHDGDHGITWRGIIKCKSFTDMLFGVANVMVCLFSFPLWTFG